MAEQPNLHPPAPPTRSRTTAWAACALAWLYAVPSVYWALGGTAGLDTVGGAIEELARTRDPAGIALGLGAGVLKVAGGLLALALDHQCGADLLRRPAGRGGGHGVGRADQPGRPGRPHRAAVAVLLWDLWFLVWGLLLGVAAWQYGRESRSRGTR